MSKSLSKFTEADRNEITQIRQVQEGLYSDMERLSVQVILTFMHKSPMHVNQILNIQKKMTKNITEHKIVALLDELVDLGYARRVKDKDKEYEPTRASLKILKKEGIDKEFLFPNQ